MGSVFKLKGGKWAIRFDVPGEGRKQKQIGGFLKKAEAEKELIRIEADILNGRYFKLSDISVSDFMELWLADHVKPNLAPKTYIFYKALFEKHIREYFSQIKLSDLKANKIEAFYRHLRENSTLGTNSIHHCHKTLRASLGCAARWDYINVSPMTKVTPPKTEKTNAKYWDPDIIPMSIRLFENSLISFHVQLALLTGLRVGEICALHKDNIDFKKSEIHIVGTAQRVTGQGIIFKNPKTEESASILPMTDDVHRILKSRLLDIKKNKIRNADIYKKEYDGYLSVFADGSFMEPNYVSGQFRKILNSQTDIPRIRFHDLRHSCASWLIYNGVDLKSIQEILRHSDFATTANTYSHVSHEIKKKALDTLKLTK
ncbi:MAG: tyrosine-type recombinase/integrase [Anaerovoracaceae bacterium]|jgi:integrase